MYAIIFLTFALLYSCSDGKQNISVQGKENVNLSDTCGDGDANTECCFVHMPEEVNSIIKIAHENEPGNRILIKGKILMNDSLTPIQDVFIYAYHTDNNGYYSKKGNEKGVHKFHGRLHGWGKTDAFGNFEISSIKPARYPENRFPAHIHAVLKIPGKIPFYINDFVFKDDALVNESYVNSLYAPGGSGVIELKKNAENILTGERIIILDLNKID